MLEWIAFILSEPPWWVTLLVMPAVCCGVYFAAVRVRCGKAAADDGAEQFRTNRFLWLLPVVIMVLGVAGMEFFVPLGRYYFGENAEFFRNHDFYGFTHFVRVWHAFMQGISAVIFTGIAWAAVKLARI